MAQGIKVAPLEHLGVSIARVDSNTTIALVGSAVVSSLDAETKAILATKDNTLLYSTADEALDVFESVGGTIREDLYDIKAQNVLTPVLISLVEITHEQTELTASTFYDSAEIKTAVIEAIDNLRYVRTNYAQRVDVIVAGWFSGDVTVLDKINSMSHLLECVSIVDLNQNSVNEAQVAIEQLGLERSLVFPFVRKVYSTFKDMEINKPYSAMVAAHIAKWDAKLGDFGFCFDHANREVFNAGRCLVKMDYIEGKACAVNNLVDRGATLVINDDGDKLYNFETPLDDQRKNKLEYIRAFDGINLRLVKNLKKYKHRPIQDVIDFAKESIASFLNEAKNHGALIGFDVWISEENTPETIGRGELHLSYKASNSVGVRSITIHPFSTDEFYNEILEEARG